VLTPAEAALGDRADLLWLIGSEIGTLLKSNAAALKREVPIYFAAPAPDGSSPDALDQVMVRGRIDLLVPTPTGPVLIDYKSDRISQDDVPERARFYAPQLNAYRTALEKITARPSATYLVFLAPRVIHPL
jgi:ATP-dependent helicase/nuclease subunit A